MGPRLVTWVGVAVVFVSVAAAGARAQPGDIDLTLSFSRLEPLAADHYEGWLLVAGEPVSTGTFTVSASGQLRDLAGNPKSVFRVVGVDLAQATKFVLTIEPAGDADPAPAFVKPLAGDLNAAKTAATLTPNLGGRSLAGIAGRYVLATPSDGMGTNELSGVWFLDLASGSPTVGLTVPDLGGTDWVYEGWAVIDGTPVTTGRFTAPTGPDGSAPFSGPQATPPFPGEDFLANAPPGLTFPTSLAGRKVVVSIEPRIDSDPGPFQFKPLSGDVPVGAADHTTYSLIDASATLPSGSVSIAQAVAADYTAWIVAGAVAVAAIVGAVMAVVLRRRKGGA